MENELYRALVRLTKDRALWRQNIPYVASLLENQSVKITAKAMWMLGEMGMRNPREIAPYTGEIAAFIESECALLRERSANALGRIGRAGYELVAPYFERLFALAQDESPNVRLSFIWASENIATNMPTVFAGHMEVFAGLLEDENERVQIEAPELLRVVGKRRPELAQPYLEKLKNLAAHHENRVVRIHANGAVRAISAQTAESGAESVTDFVGLAKSER